MIFKGLYLSSECSLVRTSPVPLRKLEFYGDSVCCGSVCEAEEYTGIQDPAGHNGRFDNAWYSFPLITGRLLNAQVNNVSQGGLALLDGSGYCFSPFYPGLETVYSKLQYIPYFGVSEWDFSSYHPNAVIIAIGQNDPHREGSPDQSLNDTEFRKLWKSKYLGIISSLKEKYPHTVFILTTTILCHDKAWDSAIDEIAEEAGSNVFRFSFRRCGRGTQGHPRICEQEEMAAELSQFIISLGDNIWAV